VQGLIPIASLIDPLPWEISDRIRHPQVRRRTESLQVLLAFAAGRTACRTGTARRLACRFDSHLAQHLLPYLALRLALHLAPYLTR
jgi:hypothetical protein